LNEIGRCQIKLSAPLAFDAYRRSHGTGSFIVIDRISNSTLGAGMILELETEETSRDVWDRGPETESLARTYSPVTLEERHARFGQRGVTVLLTGLSGAGKTTTAHALERRLFDQGRAVTVLDGSNMRLGVSKDLGFTAAERSENLRRSAELAKLMNDNGLICVCAFMAPSQDVRNKAKALIGADRFLVVHLDAPVEVCRVRDQEGLYGAADRGEISDFPGVSHAYEPPLEPDLVLPTHELTVDRCVDAILELLEQREVI
jgi:bifunctional enzyme CysN/CysC